MSPRVLFSTPFPSRLAVIACAALVILSGCGRTESEAAPVDAPAAEAKTSARSQPAAVTVWTVEGRTVRDLATFPADLQAKRRAQLAAEMSGQVATRHVEEGDRIRRGQALISLDTRELKHRLAEATAVDRQRRLQLDRAQALMEKRSITRVQLLDAVTARDVAAAQLAAVELQLEKARILAPWTGTVSKVFPEVGDFLSPGSPVAVLVDTSRLEARATVPSSDVPFLKVGMAAEVLVDVAPDQVFEGNIVRLGAELDARSRTLDAVVEIVGSDVDPRLRPGSAARVRVARQVLDDAVTAPLDSVIELEVGHVVYVVDADGRAEQRQVVLGPIIGADQVVVERGLDAGDRLVVEGHLRLSPGQAVEPVEVDAATAAREG